MKKTIIRLNNEYNDVLRTAKKRLERQRVDLNGRRGYVQTAHVNANGVRVDIILDDGNLAKDVDALTPCYDP